MHGQIHIKGISSLLVGVVWLGSFILMSQMGLLYHQLISEFGALVEQRTVEMRSVRRKPLFKCCFVENKSHMYYNLGSEPILCGRKQYRLM